MDYDELLTLNQEIYEDSCELFNDNTAYRNQLNKTSLIAQNNQIILADIEREFSQKVKLNKKDIGFLFFAAALQTIRWILLPKLDSNFEKISKQDRLNANENRTYGINEGQRSGKRYEKPAINHYEESHSGKYAKETSLYQDKLNGNSNYKYQSWLEILSRPVPYDAMRGSKSIMITGSESVISTYGSELCGRNHHVATFGHDPVLGWFFGTLNIASGMVTFCDFSTYPVIRSNNLNCWEQRIDDLHPSSIPAMLDYCIKSFQEDPKRLPAAVARQAIHMQSDKYTKDGLQIPLLKPETAQMLIDKGWNSNEAERLMNHIGKNIGIAATQFAVAHLINLLIKAIYMFFNPEEGSIAFNSVKIERILTISSAIAESANLLTVVATKNLDMLDVGGIINLVWQVAFDLKTRAAVEREFINQRLYEKIMEV